jgi:ribonuclease HI
MAGKKKKYYVVWEGNNPGIYDNWNATQLQIKGFPGAKYKSFKTKEEAETAYSGQYYDHISTGSKSTSPSPSKALEDINEIIKDSITVDAACSGNPGKMEYQGVETFTKSQLFHVGPLDGGTNNIGEFLALVHALALFQKEGNSHTTIYTDSRTAMAWVRNKKVKTTLKASPYNKKIFELIDRAITWLERNKHRNPIVKWETGEWGEIPADFGRK